MTRRPASGHVARRDVTALDATARRARSRPAVTVDHDGLGRSGGVRMGDDIEEQEDRDAVDEPPFGYARPERWR